MSTQHVEPAPLHPVQCASQGNDRRGGAGSNSSGSNSRGSSGAGGGGSSGGKRSGKFPRKAREPGMFEVELVVPPKESLGIYALPPLTHNGEQVRCAQRVPAPARQASHRGALLPVHVTSHAAWTASSSVPACCQHWHCHLLLLARGSTPGSSPPPRCTKMHAPRLLQQLMAVLCGHACCCVVSCCTLPAWPHSIHASAAWPGLGPPAAATCNVHTTC
jgi:hypothetical protein